MSSCGQEPQRSKSDSYMPCTVFAVCPSIFPMPVSQHHQCRRQPMQVSLSRYCDPTFHPSPMHLTFLNLSQQGRADQASRDCHATSNEARWSRRRHATGARAARSRRRHAQAQVAGHHGPHTVDESVLIIPYLGRKPEGTDDSVHRRHQARGIIDEAALRLADEVLDAGDLGGRGGRCAAEDYVGSFLGDDRGLEG